MEHGNGEVFTCVVRFVSGPQPSQGPVMPAPSALPSSTVPPSPFGLPPPTALAPPPPPPPSPDESATGPARKAGRQAIDMIKGSNRQVAQRFGMDDVLPSRESPGDMAIVPASESHPHNSRDKETNGRETTIVVKPTITTAMSTSPGQTPTLTSWSGGWILGNLTTSNRGTKNAPTLSVAVARPGDITSWIAFGPTPEMIWWAARSATPRSTRWTSVRSSPFSTNGGGRTFSSTVGPTSHC
ncbi:hypothetical protein CaCOL14_006605 [Colletotrichum acutatum]